MWNQISQLVGKLEFQLNAGIRNPPDWIWLHGIPNWGGTVQLSVAQGDLGQGYAVQCVGGPRGQIYLGASFYVSREGQVWVRLPTSDWSIQTPSDGTSLKWSPESRWTVIKGPEGRYS